MSKIYTKTGDMGKTKLGDKTSVSKCSLRIEACGNIDELSSFLGLAKVHLDSPELKKSLHNIQFELTKINSQLALATTPKLITIEHVKKLEQEIDIMSNTLKPLTSFIIPGENKSSSFLHVARAVCRRAERSVVKLNNKLVHTPIINYLNRLADWLFVAARVMETIS